MCVAKRSSLQLSNAQQVGHVMLTINSVSAFMPVSVKLVCVAVGVPVPVPVKSFCLCWCQVGVMLSASSLSVSANSTTVMASVPKAVSVWPCLCLRLCLCVCLRQLCPLELNVVLQTVHLSWFPYCINCGSDCVAVHKKANRTLVTLQTARRPANGCWGMAGQRAVGGVPCPQSHGWTM